MNTNPLLHWCFAIRSDISRAVASEISPRIAKHQCNNGFIFVPCSIWWWCGFKKSGNKCIFLTFFVTFCSLATGKVLYRQSPAPWPRWKQGKHGTAEPWSTTQGSAGLSCGLPAVNWTLLSQTGTFISSLWYCPGNNSGQSKMWLWHHGRGLFTVKFVLVINSSYSLCQKKRTFPKFLLPSWGRGGRKNSHTPYAKQLP